MSAPEPCRHCGGRVWSELEQLAFGDWELVERCINCGRATTAPLPAPEEPPLPPGRRRRRGAYHAGAKL